MFKNFIKIAWRSAFRQKQFALINVLGLSIGIAVCLLIGLYVYDEWNYDTFHENSEDIYRISQSLVWDDFEGKMGATGPNVAIAIRTDIPEFEAVTRLLDPGPFAVSHKDEKGNITSILQDGLLVAEGNFFDIFSFKLKHGAVETALNEPFKVVISEALAQTYFGEENPIGKSLEIKGTILEGANKKEEQWDNYIISGIVENVPSNSHIQFDLLTSMTSYSDITDNKDTWSWTAFVNYGRVKAGTDIIALEKKMQALPKKWAAATLNRIFGQTFEDLEAKGKTWTLYLDPLSSIYLKEQESGNALGPIANLDYIKTFSLIGILVLILSCINFMNLATARSFNRAKEVGVRKVLGSMRFDLIKQFTAEAFLYTLISALFAIVLTRIALPVFNHIADKSLDLNSQLGNPYFIGTFLLFIFILGIIASSYPSFYLSSFKPAQVLKGKQVTNFKKINVRNFLVVTQFTISIALIISTFFVQKQLKFTSNFNVGYQTDNVLQLHNIHQHTAAIDLIKTKLANKKGIKVMGQSHEVPPQMLRKDFLKADNAEKEVLVSRMKSDGDYLALLDLNFLTGRPFEKTRSLDKTQSVILNVAAVKAFGWGDVDNFETDSPIGKTIDRYGNKLKVIGVVEDFNFNSLKNNINPLVIFHIDNPNLPDSGTSPSFLSMRLDNKVVSNNEGMQAFIKDLKKDLTTLDAAFPFEFSFMNQQFENTFRKETKMSQLLNLFTFIALFIACMGLFGLTAFAAEQRKKEFGIRKVLGASTIELLVLFSSQTARLIAIAFFVAAPLAFLWVQSWLADFAYKTSIEIWVFILAAIITFLIAFLTIGIQSVKAALNNPIESLKVD
jgi:putative ABC transport system permease protein